MAGPGNRHCANCIGAVSFRIRPEFSSESCAPRREQAFIHGRERATRNRSRWLDVPHADRSRIMAIPSLGRSVGTILNLLLNPPSSPPPQWSWSSTLVSRPIALSATPPDGSHISLDVQKVKKLSPNSIAERRVSELIPVLGSQHTGDVSHKPGGWLPLVSARPALLPPQPLRGLLPFSLLGEQRHDGCEQFA